jgi:hypothetical protein
MVRQTALRRVRVRMREGVVRARYVFPFFDTALLVRLVLVLSASDSFVLHEKPQQVRRGLLVYHGYTGIQPLALKNARPGLFSHLLHFDPWWTMHSARGVPEEIRQAIMITNMASRRLGRLAVRDIAFDDNLDEVKEVRLGSRVLQAVSYTQSRQMPYELRRVFLTSVSH